MTHKEHHLLVINVGSASTKVGWFSGRGHAVLETIRYSSEALASYNRSVTAFPPGGRFLILATTGSAWKISISSSVAADWGNRRPPALTGSTRICAGISWKVNTECIPQPWGRPWPWTLRKDMACRPSSSTRRARMNFSLLREYPGSPKLRERAPSTL